MNRDRDWTIYFRDGAAEPPAVHPGHDRQDFDGWERMEVVRADAYRGAIDALRQLHRAVLDLPAAERSQAAWDALIESGRVLDASGGQ